MSRRDNQALCAIVFLYEHVLHELPKEHLGDIRALRSTRPRTLPTVLSAAEVARLIDALPIETDCGLMVRLMYGTGMRIGECCTLRVRDLDFDRGGNESPAPKKVTSTFSGAPRHR